MGRRYTFDALDPRYPLVVPAMQAAGLTPRVTVAGGVAEILVDGAHDSTAVKAYERNMPCTALEVGPVADAAPSSLALPVAELDALRSAKTDVEKLAAANALLGKVTVSAEVAR